MEKHPIVHHFENFIEKLKNRLITSVVFSFIITLFSQTYPLCYGNKCYSSFIEIFIRPYLIKEGILSILATEFLTTLTFFFLFWFIVLTLAIWFHRAKIISDIFVPAFIIFLFFYILILSAGWTRPIAYASGVECFENSDCIRAGYCGEVCVSKHRPIVYTEFKPDCEPVASCSCVNHKCVPAS